MSALEEREVITSRYHNSEQGLDDYDSGDENEQKIMSNIIDNAKPASTCSSDLSVGHIRR